MTSDLSRSILPVVPVCVLCNRPGCPSHPLPLPLSVFLLTDKMLRSAKETRHYWTENVVVRGQVQILDSVWVFLTHWLSCSCVPWHNTSVLAWQFTLFYLLTKELDVWVDVLRKDKKIWLKVRNENSVIIYLPSCWLRVRGSLVVYKTVFGVLQQNSFTAFSWTTEVADF